MAIINNSAVYVIIPCFNEGEVIRSTIKSVLASGYAVIVVDDGSEDNTYENVRDLEIHYLKHPINLGQGAALQTGMKYALSQEKMEAIVHFDADGQHEVSDISALKSILEKEELDLVLGSRFIGEQKSNIPRIRNIVLKIGKIVNWVFYGLWLTDTHNGFRVISRVACEQIKFRENGSSHASEILGVIKAKKLRYQEAPVKVTYSAYSMKKGQKSWNAFSILIDIILSKI